MAESADKNSRMSPVKGHNSSILEFMTDADKKKLFALGKTQEFKEKSCLFQKGDEGNNFYIVLSGSVIISIFSVQGKEIVLNTISAGDAFGEIAMLDGSERTTDAYAAKGTKILSIDKDKFLKFLEDYPHLYLGVIGVLCARLRWLSAHIESFSMANSLERVVAKLIYLAEGCKKDNGGIIVEISQDDLAKMLGLSREIVNRNLQTLQGKGILSLKRKKILIHDIEKLADCLE